MQKQIIRKLIEGYLVGASQNDREKLLAFLQTDEDLVLEVLNEMQDEMPAGAIRANTAKMRDTFQNVLAVDKVGETRVVQMPVQGGVPAASSARNWRWKNASVYKFGVAASLLLILAMGAFYMLQKPKIQESTTLAKIEKKSTQPAMDHTVPFPNRSTLTLSNGRKIVLDSAGIGSLAEEAGIKIVKKDDGSLEYITTGKSSQVSLNTLYNPPGGSPLRLTLEDGSLVLLNASSSVVFPTAFVGRERKIEMEGEVYLEIAKSDIPFYLVTNKLDVQVLGTEFNVKNYYDDKNVEVTLKEGKVAVLSGSRRYALTPGKQLRLDNKTDDVQVNTVNVQDIISWREGYHTFKGSTLSEMVKVLRRWYDIPINIEGKSNEDLIYTAIVYKNESLDKFMKRLEESSGLTCVKLGNTYYIR